MTPSGLAVIWDREIAAANERADRAERCLDLRCATLLAGSPSARSSSDQLARPRCSGRRATRSAHTSPTTRAWPSLASSSRP